MKKKTLEMIDEEIRWNLKSDNLERAEMWKSLRNMKCKDVKDLFEKTNDFFAFCVLIYENALPYKVIDSINCEESYYEIINIYKDEPIKEIEILGSKSETFYFSYFVKINKKNYIFYGPHGKEYFSNVKYFRTSVPYRSFKLGMESKRYLETIPEEYRDSVSQC